MTSGQVRPVVPISERFVLLFLVALFITVSYVTASLSPIVQIDEVRYTDPAWHLANEGHFTSTAWSNQPGEKFFAGDVPLYSLMLAGWIKLVGFGVTEVRSLNIVLAAFAIWLTLKAVTRSGLIQQSTIRVLFAMLLLFGYGTAMAYRYGRPDALMMFIASVLVGALTMERGRARGAALLVFSALAPWAGLQLVPFLLFGALLWLICNGVSAIGDLVRFALGIAIGVGGLYALYSWKGVDFRAMLASVSTVTEPLTRSIISLLALYCKDWSFLPVLVVAVVGLFVRSRVRTISYIALLVFALAIPVFMFFIAEFSSHISWMAFAPAALAACMAADQLTEKQQILPAICFLVAGSAGLPARVALTGVQLGTRDYRPVEAFVHDRVKPSDVVFCDASAYYPARKLAKEVYVESYAKTTPGQTAAMSDRERLQVSVALCEPKSNALTNLKQTLGGTWRAVGAPYESPIRLNGQSLHDWLARYGNSKYSIAEYRRSDRGRAP